MNSEEIRRKYLEYFEAPPRNHREIKPSPLVLEDDPTTLFTSAGMQQLVPYLKGKTHPEGKRLVNSQPSMRTVDIDEVGDNRHTTFFEMLGNWSLGDYFKKEQLAWIWDFFTKELGLAKERLWVSVFEGTKGVPRDEESAEIWKKLGVPQERIFYYGVKENWWSVGGAPKEMPAGEIGGPDSEVFFEFAQVKHDSKFGRSCHPNCQCGRFLEIGNSVFMQYLKKDDGSLEELPQKSVDFGGGLERIAAAVKDDPDVFFTDLFWPIVERIQDRAWVPYLDNPHDYRIIADHLKAAVFLISNSVTPSNKLGGYVLRRLLRRAVIKIKNLKVDELSIYEDVVRETISLYKDTYLQGSDSDKIIRVVEDEVKKFEQTMEKGLREIEKIDKIDAKKAFDLYQTYGFPLEVTEEVFKERGQSVDQDRFREEFKRHKDLSRSAGAGIFKGGLADTSPETTRLHTATHLLHGALRKVLGEHVEQKGSNITAKRLRFDFSHREKLTDKEISKVEGLINEQVEKDLPVTFKTMVKEDALKEGALAFFGDRYEGKVKVYTIGDPEGEWFSKEVCGGPHVSHTGEVGNVKITKQEKIGANIVRFYADIS